MNIRDMANPGRRQTLNGLKVPSSIMKLSLPVRAAKRRFYEEDLQSEFTKTPLRETLISYPPSSYDEVVERISDENFTCLARFL